QVFFYVKTQNQSQAATTTTTTTTTSDTQPTTTEAKSEEKAEEPKKSAADIAKEMLKWAKKQEKATKVQMSLKPLVKPLETKSAFDAAGGSGANVAHKMLEKSQHALAHVNDSDEEEEGSGDEKKKNSTDDVHAAVEQCHSVDDAPVPPRRHIPTAQEHREMMERALVDEAKKMCLLCKRAFPSVDVLRKHVEKSELHKKNLQEKQIEWGRQYVTAMMEGHGDQALPFPPPQEQKIVYRDRAKERREAFGLDPGVSDYRMNEFGGRSEEALRKESEMAMMRPLGADNIGSRLLKGMGWREGMGVGRNGQGR
ncbi:unnamed protein product, partial [Strongylus vulgaris]